MTGWVAFAMYCGVEAGVMTCGSYTHPLVHATRDDCIVTLPVIRNVIGRTSKSQDLNVTWISTICVNVTDREA